MPSRQAKRHAKYDEARQQVESQFPRAREVLDGAEWSILRAPDEDGVADPDLGVRIATVEGQPGVDFPRHQIFYTFDDKHVHFLTLLPVP